MSLSKLIVFLGSRGHDNLHKLSNRAQKYGVNSNDLFGYRARALDKGEQDWVPFREFQHRTYDHHCFALYIYMYIHKLCGAQNIQHWGGHPNSGELGRWVQAFLDVLLGLDTALPAFYRVQRLGSWPHTSIFLRICVYFPLLVSKESTVFFSSGLKKMEDSGSSDSTSLSQRSADRRTWGLQPLIFFFNYRGNDMQTAGPTESGSSH